MRLSQHVAISTLFSGLLLGVSGSWPLAGSSLLAGIFMDVDHVFDYYREYGRPFNVRRFFEASYQREYQRIFIVFHAWEWLPLILLAVWWSGWNPWVAGAAAGWLQHFLLDQLVNRPEKGGYFFLARAHQDFNHRVIFPPKPSQPRENKRE